MFVDKATIKVKGGDGGRGCVSFCREKFRPLGGPDGGDGGHGGNVILNAAPGEQSLIDLVYCQHYEAERGIHGKGKNQHGKRGKDITIRIPVGTVVTDAHTGEIIVDMNEPHMEFIIAKGGHGGFGNERFASSTNKAPREAQPGEQGEEKIIHLELKTIADFGLVGYPNAGKSTFLRAISKARPKVAPYPFTTLHPIVGVVHCDDYQRFTIADIPGLIDGASENIGLGHEFLRHIERTKILIYVLDTAGIDGRDPIKDFKSLQKELELYMKGLSKRPSLILANKVDLPESAKNLKRIHKQLNKWDIFDISAENGNGIEDLIPWLLEKLQGLPPDPIRRRKIEK